MPETTARLKTIEDRLRRAHSKTVGVRLTYLETSTLLGVLERMRELHRREDGHGDCIECRDFHPCATLRALDGGP